MRFAYETLEAATDARASATTADDAAAQPQEGMTIPNDQELDPLAPDACAVSPIAPGTIRLEFFSTASGITFTSTCPPLHRTLT